MPRCDYWGRVHAVDAEQVRINQEYIEMHDIASQIQNNQQLARVVKSADYWIRKQIYEALVPHLTFTPKPYLLLK